jgi:hypothetical protein
MKITVFWDMAPCSLTEVDWRDRPDDGGILHIWNVGLLRGAMSRKAVIFNDNITALL